MDVLQTNHRIRGNFIVSALDFSPKYNCLTAGTTSKEIFIFDLKSISTETSIYDNLGDFINPHNRIFRHAKVILLAFSSSFSK